MSTNGALILEALLAERLDGLMLVELRLLLQTLIKCHGEFTWLETRLGHLSVATSRGGAHMLTPSNELLTSLYLLLNILALVPSRFVQR